MISTLRLFHEQENGVAITSTEISHVPTDGNVIGSTSQHCNYDYCSHRKGRKEKQEMKTGMVVGSAYLVSGKGKRCCLPPTEECAGQSCRW